MPKRVDPRERRTLIADALLHVAARDGLEAVSLRHVAAAAGVSAGMVQHYFATKDAMMAFAMAVVRERSDARVTAAVRRLGADPAPRLLLRTLVAALLPLDDTGTDHARVALAFLAWAAVHPAAAAGLDADTAELRTFVAGLLPGGGGQRAAAGVLALMEGLGVHLLTGQCTPDEALDTLDGHLDRLFGPA